MDKIWLKQYPPGVPAEINVSEYSSVKHIVEDAMQRHGPRRAYVHMGREMRYAEVEQLSRQFGAWLQQQGFTKGDRIAIMLPNLLQYPIVLFGALRAGLVVVNTNPLYTPDELRHQLVDSGATAIVILENFCHTLEKVIADTQVRRVVVTAVGDLLGFPKGAVVNAVLRHVKKQVPVWRLPGHVRLRAALAAAGSSTILAPVELQHDDLAFLQYTGGTTGVSKGAMLSHGNMVANLLQSRAWHQQVPIEHATYFIALPLYHIFSLTVNCLLYMVVGGFGVMVPNPRDFPAFVGELIKYPPNTLNGVNTLFNALMGQKDFHKIDFSKLVASMGGGMAVQAAVAEKWKAATGCAITQGWGLTETSPVVAACRLVDTEFNGSIGVPIPSTEVSVRDDDGKELPQGASGELCVRGPQVMQGYWRRDDETALVMLPDGWLRTGDIGRMDENGYFYIEDRKKDMISVSGLKVFPNEVEEVAVRHPGVFEAAAVPEPDEYSGEV
ncbi:MAG: hypothetical protein RL026_929, partial [Pseudomonadota bacterium]